MSATISIAAWTNFDCVWRMSIRARGPSERRPHVLGHERFEELAALDAIGQLPDSEHAELQNHLEGCTRCRTSRSEFADIIERELPIVMSCRDGLVRRFGLLRASPDDRKRCFARARARGVEFSSEMEKGIPIFKVPGWGLPWRRSALVPAAALLLVA